MKIKNKKKFITTIIIIVVSALVIGYGAYSLFSYSKPEGVELFYAESDNVQVHFEDDYYFFDCQTNLDGTCIIFYPGAKVDSMAYGPIARVLAEAGYDVYLMIMPLHYAFFGVNKADIVFENTNYERYVMMGHSLGGAMAGTYVSKTSNKVDSLIFLAGYTSSDISDKDISVLSIYGSNDKVFNLKNYEKYMDNLPEDSREFVIEGGNHAQFGMYGEQKGDGVAEIDVLEQTRITVEEIVDFLER